MGTVKKYIFILLILSALGLGGYFLRSENIPKVQKTSRPEPTQASQNHLAKNPPQSLSKSAVPESEPLLVEVKPCELTQDCVITDNDPRAQAFADAAKVQAQLDAILLKQRQAPTDNPQLAKIARQFFAYPDGQVQEMALDLMATVSPEPENVEVVVRVLEHSHDARLFQVAMQEFQRYPAEEEQEKIRTLLVSTLESGGFFAAQEVARSLLPLLNPNNIQWYQEALSRLPANTAKANVLKNVLQEFVLLNSGG